MSNKEVTKSPFILITNTFPFPGARFTFSSDDEADIRAVNFASASDGKLLLIPAIYEEDKNIPERTLSVGAFAMLEKVTTHEDGSMTISVLVTRRAKVLSTTVSYNTNLATFSFPDLDGYDIPTKEDEKLMKSIISAALANFEFFKMRFPALPDDVFKGKPSLAEVIDSIAANILISPDGREKIFVEFDERTRGKKLLEVLSDEAELLALEKELFEKVRDSVNTNQKNMFLREQLRVIKNELGDDPEDEVDELFDKIDASLLFEESKEKLYKEVRRMSYFNPGSPDYALIKGYVETCLELPLGGRSKERYDLELAKKILAEDHDGLDEIKERIMEFLAVSNLKPDAPLQVLCLVGPPGTGKTSVAKSISRAMERPFVRVSLGGVRDESDIRGHRKTYVGAMPGRIINAFIQAKAQDPVILLDEIDKMGMSHNGDPASALLEVLDMEQNSSFRDHYIEIPYDLSKALFITTANSLSTVPRPLLDRMEVITLHSYSMEEKIAIAKNHLIPKQLERHGVPRSRVSFGANAVRSIIRDYTKEAGVRNLEREIASIARKCALKISGDCEGRIFVTAKNLESFLGPKKILEEKADKKNLVGVTNGLAYTELGGDLLKIEACILEGNGKLELTGSLGDVMKESAKIAISAIRQRAESAGIDKDFQKKTDIHVHVPEGAVPKDGPSAGVTLFTTLYSALTGKAVRGDVAMTGELTLTGRVLPIGGLKEKSMAALSSGISTILIPKDNLPETEKFDSALKQKISYIPCTSIDDVIREAIVR